MNDIRDKVNKLDDDATVYTDKADKFFCTAAELKAAMGAAGGEGAANEYEAFEKTARSVIYCDICDGACEHPIRESIPSAELERMFAVWKAATLAQPAREWVAIETVDDLPERGKKYWWSMRDPKRGVWDAYFDYNDGDELEGWVDMCSAYMPFPEITEPQPFVPKEPKL